MQTKEVRAFKRELENYNFYLSRIKKLDELIDYCYHLLGGIRGIDPSKEPIRGGQPNKDKEYKVREEISHHEQNKALTQAKVDYIDTILAKIEKEPKEQIIAVFVNGETMDVVASRYYIAKPTLQYKIDTELQRALRD